MLMDSLMEIDKRTYCQFIIHSIEKYEFLARKSFRNVCYVAQFIHIIYRLLLRVNISDKTTAWLIYIRVL